MDRSKQTTEDAVTVIAALIFRDLKDEAEASKIDDVDLVNDIAEVTQTNPNTVRVKMANKRELIVTVRGL